MLGAGPAGWAAAAALSARSVSTVVVAPEPTAGFVPGYGVWFDELQALELGSLSRRSWPNTRVVIDQNRQFVFPRPYARIHNPRLLEWFRTRARGVEVEPGRALSVEPAGSRLRVGLEGGRALLGRVVIDATGHGTRLVRDAPGPEAGLQVAYGATLEVESHPWPLDEAVLMDFTPADFGDRDPPSFLYVLPESPTRVFVEETSLVARPPFALERLERRLYRRLERRGVRSLGPPLDVEACFIPMGGPPAPPVQPVVGFGGAGRMVHPASGYLLTRVLGRAGPLADAIAAGLEAGDPPQRVAARAWQAIWPLPARRAHELQRFGTEVLLGLGHRELIGFFDAFFRLPGPVWHRYMGPEATPEDVRAAMLGVFARASWTLRGRLLGAGLGPGSGGLWRGLRPW